MSNLDQDESEMSIPISKLRLLRLTVQQTEGREPKSSSGAKLLASILSGVLAATIIASANVITNKIGSGVSDLNAEYQRQVINTRLVEAMDNATDLRARLTPLRNIQVIASENLANLERDIKRHVAHMNVALTILAGFVTEPSVSKDAKNLVGRIRREAEGLVSQLWTFSKLVNDGEIAQSGEAITDGARRATTRLLEQFGGLERDLDKLGDLLGAVALSAFGKVGSVE